MKQRHIWTKAWHARYGPLSVFVGVSNTTYVPRMNGQTHPHSSYYGAVIPSILNVFSMQGFLILNCIIGGQTIASVSSHLDDTLGIVIISVISLVVGTSVYGTYFSHFLSGDIFRVPFSSLVRNRCPRCARSFHPYDSTRYECVAWIPSVMAFIALLSLGYPHLHANQYTSVPAPTVASVLSFASTLASSILSWCTMTSDYGVYHSPVASP